MNMMYFLSSVVTDGEDGDRLKLGKKKQPIFSNSQAVA